jgi:hypothetical protein
MVISANTQSPLAGVLVLMPGVGQGTTDASGRFAIANVRPGIHTIRALRTGMAAPLNDTFSGNISVMPGEEVRNVRLELAPFGSITGRITDETGKPLAGLTVQALVAAYSRGRRILSAPGNDAGASSASSRTDSSGQYSIDLPPGVYYVTAEYSPSGSFRIAESSGRGVVVSGTIRTFFPGTDVEKLAASIVVLGGGTVPGIDFKAATRSPATVTVAGTVEGRRNSEEDNRTRRSFSLISRDSFSQEGWAIRNIPEMRAPTDTFEIGGVPRGIHDLVVDDVMQDGSRGRGITAIRVGDEDLKDVRLILQKGNDIQGRILVSGPSRSIDLSTLTVLANSKYTTAASDGTFTLRDVLSGTYSVRLEGLPPDAYVSDLRQGSRSLFDAAGTLNGPELEMRDSATPVEIFVSPAGATIDGIVESSGQANVAGATIVLVPPPSRRFVQSAYKATVADGRGEFRLRGIAPGTYQLFAWNRVPDTAWLNPEFMARYEGRGQSITVTEGARFRARIALLRYEE